MALGAAVVNIWATRQLELFAVDLKKIVYRRSLSAAVVLEFGEEDAQHISLFVCAATNSTTAIMALPNLSRLVPPRRALPAVMMFLGIFMGYLTRININIAIIPMTKNVTDICGEDRSATERYPKKHPTQW